MSVELKCRKCNREIHKGGRVDGVWLDEKGNSWCVNESTHEPPLRWFQDYKNMIKLTRYLADEGATGDEVAKAVEKPWLFNLEWINSGGKFDDYTIWLIEYFDSPRVPEWTL